MSTKDQKESHSWIAFMSNKVKSGGGINLAQGLPGFKPPEELLQILRGYSLEPVHQYPAGNGYPPLVEQICKSYNNSGHGISPGEVLIVQGATEGINLVYIYLLKSFGRDWGVLAFDPVYESYPELPDIYGNNFFRLSLGIGGSINRSGFKKLILRENIKLVFVNSPGNPYGKIWTEDEFQWLFSMADKHDFYILHDAVYKDLYFDEDPPFIPLSVKGERLFYVNSFSKMLSVTGWRVGYLITTENHMKKIRAIHDYTGLCASSVMQYSISDYLDQNEFGRDYLCRIREKLAHNYLYVKSELTRLNFHVERAGGGYFIWCRLPENAANGVDFALQLYEQQKVAVVPGIHFSPDAGRWIRINVAREKEELSTALGRIGNFAGRY